MQDGTKAPVCLVIYSPAAWDSTHFKIPMATIDAVITSKNIPCEESIKKEAICQALKELKRRGFSHIAAKVDIYDYGTVHALEMNGFRLMDTTVTYGFDFRKSKIPLLKSQVVLRLANPGDEKRLIKIAADSFSAQRVAIDRFHADPALPKEKSDSLYVAWIRNSFKGEAADAIIVAELDGVPVGFTTIQHVRADSNILGLKIGAFVLSAVDPKARGRGIYTSIILEGLQYLKSKVEIIELGTQITNLPVQRALSSIGFKLSSATYAFHKVIDEC